MKPSALTHTLSSYGRDQGRPEETGHSSQRLAALVSRIKHPFTPQSYCQLTTDVMGRCGSFLHDI